MIGQYWLAQAFSLQRSQAQSHWAANWLAWA